MKPCREFRISSITSMESNQRCMRAKSLAIPLPVRASMASWFSLGRNWRMPLLTWKKNRIEDKIYWIHSVRSIVNILSWKKCGNYWIRIGMREYVQKSLISRWTSCIGKICLRKLSSLGEHWLIRRAMKIQSGDKLRGTSRAFMNSIRALLTFWSAR